MKIEITFSVNLPSVMQEADAKLFVDNLEISLGMTDSAAAEYLMKKGLKPMFHQEITSVKYISEWPFKGPLKKAVLD